MKNILAAVITLIMATTLIVGCGLVDGNPGATQFEDDQPIESTYSDFYMGTVDTSGYDDPP